MHAKLRSTFRDFVGQLNREVRIALMPVSTPDKWVFVVGCYNSGTELLMNLLGRHPDIASLPVEGQFLSDELTCDSEVGLPRMWALREELFRLTENDKGPDAERIKREWLLRLDRNKSIFLEKSPPNIARTRWLQSRFENAHFIALVRNGYAAAEGIRRKAGPLHLRAGWPIDLCARQWVRSLEVILEDQVHLQNLHWVRYETLTADPVGETARILDFLGLSGNVPVQAADARDHLTIQDLDLCVRNLNAESIERLSAEDIAIINREAGEMMTRFGYELIGGPDEAHSRLIS